MTEKIPIEELWKATNKKTSGTRDEGKKLEIGQVHELKARMIQKYLEEKC